MSKTIKDRVESEREELAVRMGKLDNFIDTDPRFDSLSDKAKELLIKQLRYMGSYKRVLDERIALMETESPNV